MIPDYAGPCLSNVVPALLGPAYAAPAWLPEGCAGARQLLLVVFDGLGWEQMELHRDILPTLNSLRGGPILSVVPSTTATALTSITTGLPPGEHGVIGYRMDIHGSILNVLRWSTARGDARRVIPPTDIQPYEPFLGHRPPVVTKAEFEGTGFSGAHLAGVRWRGWRMPSTLVTQVDLLLKAGEPLVYAYYDGVDKVAHEFGLGEHYRAELGYVDRLVADLVSILPPGAILVMTSDHGQVDVGDAVFPPAPDVLDLVRLQSGEGRARWLHARPGRAQALHETAAANHGDVAWVVTREQVLDEHWFGPKVSQSAADRMGDVLLAARQAVAFDDPADTGPFHLVARHGSFTADEMRVPLLAAGAE